MIYPHFQCVVSGEAFFPSRIPSLEGLVWQKITDAGLPEQTGSAVVSSRSTGSLEELVACLEKHAGTLRQYGAEEFEVYAAIRYEDQANWEIPPDLLGRLGRLNAHLLMSFYEEQVTSG